MKTSQNDLENDHKSKIFLVSKFSRFFRQIFYRHCELEKFEGPT